MYKSAKLNFYREVNVQTNVEYQRLRGGIQALLTYGR